eukprot:10605509-Karenia_brevis.AAC.1
MLSSPVAFADCTTTNTLRSVNSVLPVPMEPNMAKRSPGSHVQAMAARGKCTHAQHVGDDHGWVSFFVFRVGRMLGVAV